MIFSDNGQTATHDCQSHGYRLYVGYDLNSLVVVIDRYLRTTPGLSLQTLAQRLNVERHSIERSVRRARGLTFRQLRNGIMLEKATQLLTEHPHCTVKEIAFTLGYRSQSAFGRFIKEVSGTSPTGIRIRGFKKLQDDHLSTTSCNEFARSQDT